MTLTSTGTLLQFLFRNSKLRMEVFVELRCDDAACKSTTRHKTRGLDTKINAYYTCKRSPDFQKVLSLLCLLNCSLRHPLPHHAACVSENQHYVKLFRSKASAHSRSSRRAEGAQRVNVLKCGLRTWWKERFPSTQVQGGGESRYPRKTTRRSEN